MEILKNDTKEQAINSLPLISVVTVCFNAAATIEETIQSVLGQTYPKVEYIIIDGGSTDGTVDIIKRYADRLAYWVSEPDKGIYDAMNKGIAAASGDYINFMNAGDKFHNEKVLSDFAPYIDRTSDIVYGNFIRAYQDCKYFVAASPLTLLAKRMVFCHQSAFIKVPFHKKYTYNTRFKIAGDYNFFYTSYFERDAKFQHIPVIVAEYDNTTGISKSGRTCWIACKEHVLAQNTTNKFVLYTTSILLFLRASIKSLFPDNLNKIIRQYIYQKYQ